jgi:hypothetical protein
MQMTASTRLAGELGEGPKLHDVYVCAQQGRVTYNIFLLLQDAGGVSAYVPEGVWYDAFTNETVKGGAKVWRDAPVGEVAVLYRGGSIIALHDDNSSLVSEQVRKSLFTLVVAFPDLVSTYSVIPLRGKHGWMKL